MQKLRVLPKLKFYAAYIVALPSEVMFGLAEEIRRKAESLGAQNKILDRT